MNRNLLLICIFSIICCLNGRKLPKYVKLIDTEPTLVEVVNESDHLSSIMFYRETEDCPRCDHFWKTYLKVAKKLKDVMKFYVMDCDIWTDYASLYKPDFNAP